VGITRARERAIISFTANRMIFGRWQSVIPSRFIDEMPAEHCEAKSETGYYDAGPGFKESTAPANPMRSGYESPGWKRFQASQSAGRRADPGVIEGKAQLIESGGANSVGGNSKYKPGDRVFHLKFGYGVVKVTDGAKLTVAFDKAGTKKVVASFVEDAP
jgi:DNA helicase-2/ATP-dependent DNA helicase PcrA